MVLLPLCGFGFAGALVFGFIVKRLKVKKKFKTVFIFNQAMILLLILVLLFAFHL